MRPHTALSGILLLASLARAAAQTPTADDALLHRMAEQSIDYRKNLPSFTCQENVATTYVNKNKIITRIEFVATIRVTRTPEGGLKENYTITSYMGAPPSDIVTPSVPFYVEGGLGRGVPYFFTPDKQACYSYSFKDRRIDFVGHPGTEACSDVHNTRGFALLDDAGNLLHGETHLPPAEARHYSLTSFATVDYAPVSLNGKEYHLPSHLYAEIEEGKSLSTFDAHYTNCKLFHATVTLGPATIQPETPPPPDAPH